MYNNNQGQQRHSSYDRRPQQCNRQETDQRRYSQSSQNIDNNNVSVLNSLENYSTKQMLTQSMLNTLQEYDGSDREATIPWLDQVELVGERKGTHTNFIIASTIGTKEDSSTIAHLST